MLFSSNPDTKETERSGKLSRLKGDADSQQPRWRERTKGGQESGGLLPHFDFSSLDKWKCIHAAKDSDDKQEIPR